MPKKNKFDFIPSSVLNIQNNGRFWGRGRRASLRGVRGSGMKSRRYITRLLLFSFLLAVPVWAQDEVAPDPDAATPAPGQARHLPTIFGRDAIFSGIGAGEERLWKKKASPSTCSTLRICRAI